MNFPIEESDNSTSSVEDGKIKQTQLKIQFHSTRKGDLETIESYVKKLRSIANSVAEIDSPISDSDMVLQLLAGLPIQYLLLKNTISSKCPLPTFGDACFMVYKQEGILLKDQEEQSSCFPKEESDSSIKDDQIRRAQLQIQFHGTRKEDFQSIEAYVKRLKSIADSLAEIGDQISNTDKVLQLLAGLPIQYLPLKNTISSMRPLPDFEEASSMLYMQEDKLLQDREKKFKADAGGAGAGAGAEQSSGLFTADTFFTVVDTVGVVVGAVGAVGTICAGVGILGTAVGAVSTVNATRMLVGSAITVVVGWKIWQRK
ncbi:uncharacterized protein LOC125837757 [Solanum verrucosum]|uniref:uncharacterized protein LOC125837757 n=1 Tax=Solanum verrucosum TaxID=315347 RepID=UPI0020D1D51A|nr:uncharacterized protein LOC125837757 [Solanum verrucosum]